MTEFKKKKLTIILQRNGDCEVNEINCYGCPVFKCRNQKRKDKSGVSPEVRYAEAKRIMKDHVLFREDEIEN